MVPAVPCRLRDLVSTPKSPTTGRDVLALLDRMVSLFLQLRTPVGDGHAILEQPWCPSSGPSTVTGWPHTVCHFLGCAAKDVGLGYISLVLCI